MRQRSICYFAVFAVCLAKGARAQPPSPSPSSRPNIVLPVETQRFLAAALTELIQALPSDPNAVCLTIRGGPPAYAYSPGPGLLEALRPAARRIVGPVDCPPTYDQMYVLVDSNGRNISPKRPPGYIDPQDIVLDEYQLVGADSAALRATASQGTINLHFACVGRRDTNRRWQASCARPSRSISALPSNESLQLTSASTSEASRLSGLTALRPADW